MVPDALAAPQFRADAAGEDPAAVFVAEYSDEVMRRLRHPFEPAPARRRRAPAGRAPVGGVTVP